MKEEFIELLRSTKREGIENLLAFLEKSDFYTAPASTRFHGNYEGGLLEHSMKVYEIFNEKIKNSRNRSDFVYFVCDHWNACTICTYAIGKQNK